MLAVVVVVPAYRDYTIRARVSEAIFATTGCRTAVAKMYASGDVPIAGNDWRCNQDRSGPVSPYAQTITIDSDGVITVKTRTSDELGPASGKTLTLTPVDGKGSALTFSYSSRAQVDGFKCAALTLEPRYLPRSCPDIVPR